MDALVFVGAGIGHRGGDAAPASWTPATVEVRFLIEVGGGIDYYTPKVFHQRLLYSKVFRQRPGSTRHIGDRPRRPIKSAPRLADFTRTGAIWVSLLIWTLPKRFD